MNPAAPVFVPRASSIAPGTNGPPSSRSKDVRRSSRVNSKSRAAPIYLPDDLYEVNISPDELEELEAADDWVALQAQMEMEEMEHVKQFALINAPASVDWSAVDWKAVADKRAHIARVPGKA